MRKIVTAIVLMWGMNFLTVQKTLAVPAAPSPVCEITAEVSEIENIKTTTPPLSAAPGKVEYYSVKLQILECSAYRQEGDKHCEELYPLNSEKEVILSLKEHEKKPIEKGEQIKAKIHFGGDEWFHGIFLTDILILKSNNSQ